MNLRIYTFSLSLILCFAANIQAQTQIALDSLMGKSGNFIVSATPNSNYALEMTSGDFNGDGIQDIVITNSDNTGGSGSDSRRITITFGRDSLQNGNPTRVSFFFTNNDPNIPSSNGFGREVGSGDLNNDGIDDLIIGMAGYNNSEGRLYVVYGKQNWPETSINIATIDSSRGFRLSGSSIGDGRHGLGEGYAIGDFNDDGLNDLFVSAPYSTISFRGKGYVVYGTAIQGNLTIDLDTLSQNSGVVIYPTNNSDGVGSEASFIDINGDGADDLLMANENAWSQGRLYILFGNTSHPDSINLSAISRGVNGMTIFGSFNPTLTRFGKDFATGDFNGDGEMDFIVSATRTGTTRGSVYIIYGGEGVFDDNVYPTFMDSGEGLVINGESLNYLGKFLDVADFNNDGFDDVIFTGGIHDLPSNITENYEDKLRVLLGTDQALPDTLDLENPAPEFDLFEISFPSRFWDFGNSVTAIDINNDNKQDIIFGARFDDPNNFEERFSAYFILNSEFMPVPDSSQTDPTYFDGGEGTDLDPYLISKVEQLDSLLLFPEKNFLLTSDLDLATTSEYGWIPIGYARDDQHLIGEREIFTGCFDGGGYKITNLNINNRGMNVGLFYSVSGCVKNLTIDEATINYIAPKDVPDSLGLTESELIEDIPRFAGVVASRIEMTGEIENVDVINSSIEFGSVGMIAGWNEGSISSSYTQGIISESNQAGGVTAVNLGSIHQSAFEGSFFVIQNATGGVTGTNLEGTITESYATTSTQKTGIFGGITGIYQYGILENNYSEFDVQDSSSVGGVIGLYGLSGILGSTNKPLSIKNNYAFGTIDSKKVFENFYKGIVGQAFLNSEDSTQTVLKVNGNYWNEELFGKQDSLIGFRIEAGARSILEMKQEANYENWDFANIWTIDEGETFPYLRNNPPFRKPGEGILSTNIQQESDLPQKISLSQNYPNPFNPSTVISYELSKTSTVSLEVFNMLGQKVQTLVGNTVQSSGTYSITFNAQGFSSGVYIYQLKLQGGVTLTKRLTLIR